MGCGCTGRAARGRRLCPEGQRLQEAMRAAHRAEMETAARCGSPAHPEAQEAMRERLRRKHAFFGHLRTAELERASVVREVEPAAARASGE